MTDNEPPEGAPPPEDSSVASGEQESAPPQPSPDAARLGGIITPIGRTPVISPIQVPVSEPSIGPTAAGQPVLQVGPAAGPVLIDVGDQAAQAAITRNGAPIPVIDIPINNLQPIHLVPPTFSPRVVSQSVAALTRVPQGTSVDLVLASPTILPISIIPGIHPWFLGPSGQAPYTLSQVYTQFIQNNAGMQGVLTRNAAAPDVNSADGQAIVQAFQALSPPVTLSTPGDMAGAFAGLQAAMTFGS